MGDYKIEVGVDKWSAMSLSLWRIFRENSLLQQYRTDPEFKLSKNLSIMVSRKVS